MPDQEFDFDKKLIRVPSYPEESAADYIIRLFEVRGLTWNKYVISRAGGDITRLLNGDYEELLANLSDEDPGRFAMTTPITNTTKEVTIGGRTLNRVETTTHLRRWCPVCFREDLSNSGLNGRNPAWRLHRRWWWNMISLRACPIHHVRLERECPICHTEVLWGSGSLTTCRFGHSLLECLPIDLNPDDCIADQWLLARLGDTEHVRMPILGDMTYSDAVRMLEVVGQTAVYGPYSIFSDTPEDERGRVLSAGVRTFLHYPESLNSLLDTIANESSRKGTRSDMEKTYGNILMNALKFKANIGWRNLLDDIYRHHAKQAAIFGYVRGKRGAARYLTEDAPMTVADACKKFGKASPTMKRYLQAIGAIGTPKKSTATIVVSKVDIEELETLFASAIDIDGIMELLNVPRTTVVRMIWAGCLPENAIFKEVKADKYRFTKPEITEWLSRLAGDLPTYDVCPTNLVPITDGKKANFGGLIGALRLIEQGKSKPCGRLSSQRGLRSLLIDIQDFEKTHFGMQSDFISTRQVGKMIGVCKEMAGMLMQHGLIEMNLMGKNRFSSTKESVGAFIEKTISSTELARRLNSKPQYVVPFLRDIGIETVVPEECYLTQRGRLYWKRDIPANIATLFENRVQKMPWKSRKT